jgi:hypothetical protein
MSFQPPSDPFSAAALLLVLAGFVGLLGHLVSQRARSAVFAWAAANGYDVLALDRRRVRTGPFSVWVGLPIFHVVVADRGGREREGYLRCGDWLMGVLSDEVEVAWTAEPDAAPDATPDAAPKAPAE